MKLNDMQRSRLKLTIAGMVSILVVMLFPIIIISKAAKINVFDINAPWVFLTSCVTVFSGIIGYYVAKESLRPSLLTNIISSPVKKILKGEDESDPEIIPL